MKQPDETARGTPAAEPRAVPPTGEQRGPADGQRIVAALLAFTAESDGHRPWMAAEALARGVGAPGAHDPQFEAEVQALYDSGAIRLMAGGNASGRSFYSAMLVPTAEPAAPE